MDKGIEYVLSYYEKQIYKVVKCDLITNMYEVLKQRDTEEFSKRKFLKGHDENEEWRYEERLIHPNDLSLFKHNTDNQNLLEYFEAGNREYSLFYRRKLGNFYKWVRMKIFPAEEYSANNKLVYFVIDDADQPLTNLANNRVLDRFVSQETGTTYTPDLYQEGLAHSISYLTYKYIDFYIVDLIRDVYIIYKMNPYIIRNATPYIGSYSQLASYYKDKIISQSINYSLGDFRINKPNSIEIPSPEDFKYLLKDKVSIEFIYRHINGQLVKTICTKIESENDIPKKIICCTIPWTEEDLLKVKTFGNFDVFNKDGIRMKFTKKQSKQLLAYLIDKQGFPVSTKEIIEDILEKSPDDLNAVKYVSTLTRNLIKDLEKEGYTDIIIKEWNSLRINVEKIDCDYYKLLNGDTTYYHTYHNEYMKEYSWAEETNAELLMNSNN